MFPSGTSSTCILATFFRRGRLSNFSVSTLREQLETTKVKSTVTRRAVWTGLGPALDGIEPTGDCILPVWVHKVEEEASSHQFGIQDKIICAIENDTTETESIQDQTGAEGGLDGGELQLAGEIVDIARIFRLSIGGEREGNRRCIVKPPPKRVSFCIRANILHIFSCCRCTLRPFVLSCCGHAADECGMDHGASYFA